MRRDYAALAGRYAAFAAIVAALTFISGTLALHAQREPSIWLVNAAVFAVMLRSRLKRRLAYLVVSAAVVFVGFRFFGEPPLLALSLTLANACELQLTALVLGRMRRWDLEPLRARRFLDLACWAGVFAPAVGATVAALLVTAISGVDFAEGWRRWFCADALGMVVLAPLLMLVEPAELRALFARRRLADTLATLGILVGVDVLVFGQNHYPALFVAFPMLVVAAFRLQVAGAALAVLATAAVALLGTIAGHGPITLVGGASVLEEIRFVQIYLAFAVTMTLPIATLLGDHERLRLQREEQIDRLAENHRRLEEQRAALIAMAEAAQEATRAKSEFLATLSHELRTPMTGVLGMVELLRDEPDGPERVQMLDTLQRSTRSLLGVIGDVLDFSKIEAGKLVIESVDSSVREVVTTTIDFFSNAASAKNVLLEAKFSGTGHPDRMCMDPHRTRQILSNFIGNALKFTSAGTITVSVDVEPLDDGAYRWRFAVRDTGIGVDVEARERIFAAFTQADASTTRRFGGSGLGLTISKRLVEAMGGAIGIESDTGIGSTFWFTIPLLAATPSDAASEGRAIDPFAPSEHPLRILIAEDNRTNQMLIRKMLERMGHDVTCVADGRLAVDAVAAHAFDVVLMDMHMPEMDGPTATRCIRAMPSSAAGVPIVALTADAVSEHRTLFQEAGLTAFLSKPIDAVGLRRVLDEIGAQAVREPV